MMRNFFTCVSLSFFNTRGKCCHPWVRETRRTATTALLVSRAQRTVKLGVIGFVIRFVFNCSGG